MNAEDYAPKSKDLSSPGASSSGLRLDKGKAKEVSPSAESRSSTPRVDKGKAKEVYPPTDSNPPEEIFSPGTAAQRRQQGNPFVTQGGGRTLGGIPGLGIGMHIPSGF
jgi:hypothetical protein